MRYQARLEKGWMVYFEGNPSNEEKPNHFGVRFFSTKDNAQSFIAECVYEKTDEGEYLQVAV